MRKQWTGRIYLGRDPDGKQLFHWVGRFPTRRERDEAVAQARVGLRSQQPLLPMCDEYVDRYLVEYERFHKRSSYDTARQRLRLFRDHFEGRTLDSIDRAEAKEWAATVPPSCVPMVVTLFNHAIVEDDLPLRRNPFRGLGRRTKGRAEQPPPTDQEFDALLAGCGALGGYAPRMRALLRFAAFTLMRPGELYELEWADLDFDAMRIRKGRRLYRGDVDEPKSGAKTIALTPPARDAILGQPRDERLVFTSKQGKRLSQATMSGYWRQVLARADLDFDFYHASKHYGVHYMWTRLSMSRRAIAAQAGWSLGTVDKMLAIYGHGEVGALDEVDAAFAGAEVVPLRKVGG